MDTLEHRFRLHKERIKGVCLTHTFSSRGGSKHENSLSVITSLKECGKERGSAQHETHKVYRVGVWYKQYTGGEFLCNSVTPALAPTPSPPNPLSLVCFLDSPRKPVSVGIRCLMTNLYIQYSRLFLVPIDNINGAFVIVYFFHQREYRMWDDNTSFIPSCTYCTSSSDAIESRESRFVRKLEAVYPTVLLFALRTRTHRWILLGDLLLSLTYFLTGIKESIIQMFSWYY